jgi:exoribonuclease-2
MSKHDATKSSGAGGHVSANEAASQQHLPHKQPSHNQHGGHGFDLAAAALAEMHAARFKPEFGPGVDEQMAEIRDRFAKLPTAAPEKGVEDLRALAWSSIDNDTSKDLDQIEVAERVAGGILLRVAIGDVATAVAKGTPIDKHAQDQTQTIYTAVKNFPCFRSSFPPASPA